MMQKFREKLFSRETVSYLAVGLCTTFVGLVVFALAVYIGLGTALSNTLSHVLATLFAFLTNKAFVFRSADWSPMRIGKEFAKFIGARVFTYVGETVLLVALVDFIGFHAVATKVFTTGLVVLGNYFFSKFFVFRE